MLQGILILEYFFCNKNDGDIEVWGSGSLVLGKYVFIGDI